MDLLAAASFVDLATFSLGVAADLSESVSSASVARRSVVFGSKQESRTGTPGPRPQC